MNQAAHLLAGAGPALAHPARIPAIADRVHDWGMPSHGASDGTPWLLMGARRGYTAHVLPSVLNPAALGSDSLGLPAEIVDAVLDIDLALLHRLALLDWCPSMQLAAAMSGTPVVTLVNAHVMDNASGSFVDVCVATLPTPAPALRQELLVDADAPHAAIQEALWSI